MHSCNSETGDDCVPVVACTSTNPRHVFTYRPPSCWQFTSASAFSMMAELPIGSHLSLGVGRIFSTGAVALAHLPANQP
jgi:hypothetical protein